MVVIDIKLHQPNEKNQLLLKKIIAACINLKEFYLIEKWFVHLGIVMLFQKQSTFFDRALQELLNVCCEPEIINIEQCINCARSCDQNTREKNKTLYQKTKFYIHFKQIQKEGERKILEVESFGEANI